MSGTTDITQDLTQRTSPLLADALIMVNSETKAVQEIKIADLRNFLAAFVAGGIVPQPITAGTVLGSPAQPQIYYAPAGSYTTPTGVVVLTENFNLWFWDKVIWKYMSIPLDVDLTDINTTLTALGLTKANISDTLKSKKNTTGRLMVRDVLGRITTYWNAAGELAVWKFTTATEKRIRDVVGGIKGLRNANGYLVVRDTLGRVASYWNPAGELAVRKFTTATEKRIRDVVGGLKGLRNANGYLIVRDTLGRIATYWNASGELAVRKFTPSTEKRIITFVNANSQKIRGQYLRIVGDSISSANGATGLATTDVWHGRLKALYGCTVDFDGQAGSCFTYGVGAPDALSKSTRIATLTAGNPKNMIAFCGVNDFLRNVPLGNFGDDRAASFCGAVYYFCTEVMKANPMGDLYLMTPLHTNFTPYEPFMGAATKPETNHLGLKLTDYVDAMEKIAGLVGARVIRTHHNSGITQYNINSLADDFIHIKETGQLMTAQCVAREMQNYLN